MPDPLRHLATTAGLVGLALLALPSAGYTMDHGRTLFANTHRCVQCHAVAAAGIEARRTGSQAAGDLSGFRTTDLERLGAYLRQQSGLNGQQHPTSFKGTDEELLAIVDWLRSLP